MKLLSFIFVLLVAQPILALADEDATAGTGNELIESCSQKEADLNSSEWNGCVEYVMGVDDGMQHATLFLAAIKIAPGKKYTIHDTLAVETANTELQRLWCMPPRVTRNQAALVVSKYLADNPDKLHQSSASLVVEAFHKAWPCAVPKK